MNYESLKQFESSLGFNSFNSIYFKALMQLDIPKTYDEYLKLIEDFSNILYIEDDVIKSVYGETQYNKIINSEGKFQIGSRYIFSVTETDIYVWDNTLSEYSVHKNIFSSEKSFTSGAKVEAERLTGDTKLWTKNESGCKNDRRVELYFFWNVQDVTWYITHNYIRTAVNFGSPTVHVRVTPYIRNLWCNWKRYETNVAWRNFSFSSYYSENSYNTEFPLHDGYAVGPPDTKDYNLYPLTGYPDYTTSDISSSFLTINRPDYNPPGDSGGLAGNYSFGDGSINESNYLFNFSENVNFHGFEKFHIEIYTRGLGYWVTYDY